MTTIRDALERLWRADDHADMVFCDDRWESWGQVRALTESIDRVLRDAGCGMGGRVAVVLGNRVESIAAMIAIWRGERTLVTLSPLQPADRLSADLSATRVSYVLAPEGNWQQEPFRAAVGELGAGGWSVEGETVAERTTLTGEPAAGDPAVAVEMMTSGTTGPPKRIPLTHARLEMGLSAALQHYRNAAQRDKPLFTGAVGIVPIPLVHLGGLWALLQSLVAARRFVLLERFTVPSWHAAVKEHRPVMVGLPPAAIQAVLDANIPAEDLASIRAVTAGSSPTDPALVDAFYDRYGIPVLIVYGATEFSGGVAGWTLDEFREKWQAKKGSVGCAFPGARLRVVDEGGAELAPGRTGRLQVVSAQTGEPPNAWVTTSDLAHLDEDGFLYIDGRADDVILRGGFKILPDTVITALRRHEAVADAAVVGLPDRRLGQIPVAAVELRDGASVTPDELRVHCRSLLTPYEVPVEVHVVDELPRGAALKVDRRPLIALLERMRAAMPQPSPVV